LWFIVIFLLFFCLSKTLFSGFLQFKGVRAKIFQPIDFLIFFFLLQSGNELLVPEMQKDWGSPTSFQPKACENYPDFEKLAQLIQHGLQGL